MGNKSSQWGGGGGGYKETNYIFQVYPPDVTKTQYLKLETRYVKTVFRNEIYDKFRITMGEENRYCSQVFHLN